MCNHFDAEQIRFRAVNQRKGKTGKNELAQVGINCPTHFGMIEQKICRTSNFGFEALAQTRDL